MIDKFLIKIGVSQKISSIFFISVIWNLWTRTKSRYANINTPLINAMHFSAKNSNLMWSKFLFFDYFWKMKSKFELIALKCRAFVIWCNSIVQNDRPPDIDLRWVSSLFQSPTTLLIYFVWMHIVHFHFHCAMNSSYRRLILSIYLLSLSFPPLSLSFRCSLSFFLLFLSLALSFISVFCG